jgi:hypothetical protein
VTIDNAKIEVKEKINAMKLMLQRHYVRFKLVDSEAFIKEFSDYTNELENVEKDFGRRERALKAFLEGAKLTHDEIDEAPDQNAAF